MASGRTFALILSASMLEPVLAFTLSQAPIALTTYSRCRSLSTFSRNLVTTGSPLMVGRDLIPPSVIKRRALLAGSLAIPPAVLYFSTSAADAKDKFSLGGGPKGLIVPKMGVGCWAWGDKSGVWGYEGYDKSLSEDTISQAFKASIESGVNFFDTAEVYGNGVSEEILGRLLKGLPASKREEVTVATKFYPVDPSSNLPRLTLPKDLLAALDASLSRLQMSSVDLYQIHAPLLPVSADAVADALAEAVKSGRAKAVGVSNYALAEMLPIYDRLDKAHGIPLASNQVELSLLRQLPVSGGLLRESRKLGVGILAYSPLAMGRLTGKYSKENKPSGSRFFGKASPEQVQALVTKMKDIGDVHGGKSVAQVALNWVVCEGAVPIPGAKNARQAADNAGALGWELTAGERAELAALGKEGKTNPWQHDGKVARRRASTLAAPLAVLRSRLTQQHGFGRLRERSVPVSCEVRVEASNASPFRFRIG